jgi:hypothetical protein
LAPRIPKQSILVFYIQIVLKMALHKCQVRRIKVKIEESLTCKKDTEAFVW